MQPLETGKKYDKIAQWWHDQHLQSSYGVPQIEKALAFINGPGKALDVGCGAGGRYVRLLQQRGFSITGLDASAEMVRLARQNHPQKIFLHQDISTWETQDKFDFVVAWDSLFHLPFHLQEPVLVKLCGLLAEGGILTYTFGDAEGAHTDTWHDEEFGYSSIGINKNVQVLMDSGLSLLHLELDQHPEKHVFAVARKR